MLHFDLLRLFGPVYSDQTANQKSIPYQKSSAKEIQPLLPASEVLANVIADLEEAARLLKDADPNVTDGIRNEEENDNGLGKVLQNDLTLRLN